MVTIFAGSSLTTYADGHGTNAGFSIPNGVFVTSNGEVFVGDFANRRIRKIYTSGYMLFKASISLVVMFHSMLGQVITLAGSGVNDIIDGVGAEAAFSAAFYPNVHPVTGAVFVSDRSMVRKIVNQAGAVQTIFNLIPFNLSSLQFVFVLFSSPFFFVLFFYSYFCFVFLSVIRFFFP